MRRIASAKAAMNEQHAERRQAQGTQHKGGYVVLGQRPVSEVVLQGRGLRALADASETRAPVEVLRAALSAAHGGLAPPREAAAAEEFVRRLGDSGFASVLPQEFMAQHFMDFGTPKLGTAAPPRSVGYYYWGAFPPVPRDLSAPDHALSPAAAHTQAGTSASPGGGGAAGAFAAAAAAAAAAKAAAIGAAGEVETAGGSRGDPGGGDGRQQGPLGGASLARVLDSVAAQLMQKRQTPRTAALAAAAARAGPGPPAGLAAKSAAAALCGLAITGAGGRRRRRRRRGRAAEGRRRLPGRCAARGVRRRQPRCREPQEPWQRLHQPPGSAGRPVAPAVADGADVAAASGGAADGGCRAPPPGARGGAAGIGGRLAASPKPRPAPSVFRPGSPMAVTSHKLAGGPGANAGAGAGAGAQAALGAAGFKGPLLQANGGLAGAAIAAARQRQQQHDAAVAAASEAKEGGGGAAAAAAGVRHAGDAAAVAAGGTPDEDLPAGVECAVVGRDGEQRLVFHGSS
ncbi:MAG: hypothetical protein J3K34DRAFT_394482 [Monoraphidium minutum]|nr:MAG: hypothetical protein J3K34DRAFT_394482 [Monoraphidium minutum]